MKYSKWLNIHLTHGYFADGRETSFQFVPTQDCEKQLKLYRFLFRSTDFGFAILEDSEKEQENNRQTTIGITHTGHPVISVAVELQQRD